MRYVLLKNCLYVYKSYREGGIRNCDVLIRGDRIEEVGREIVVERTPDDTLQVIKCDNYVVVPGFVNTHHHFYQTLTRNLPEVQNAKLFDWLVFLYEIWKNIDEEAVYYSTLLAAGELLKTGCTCTTDHHYLYPDSFTGDLMGIQFEAASDLGIRFAPTRGSMSLSKKDGGLPPDSVVQTEDVILKDSRRVIEKYHDATEHSMSRVILAPCSPFSVTPSLLKETAKLARVFGVKLHTHLAETADEDDYCINNLGVRPLAFMEKYDFIGSDVFFAHGIHFKDDELKRLADTHTSVVHCPSSNMRLGSGIARVKEMLELGITVGLGVDGSASNDTSDMLGEMRNALLLQRVRYGAEALTARDVFKLATENGAEILGFKNTGKIEKGYQADLAVFNMNKLEYAGSLSDPLAALVFAGYNHGTEYTIVNGRIVVEHGRLVMYDEDAITKEVNEISYKLTH